MKLITLDNKAYTNVKNKLFYNKIIWSQREKLKQGISYVHYGMSVCSKIFESLFILIFKI